VDTVSTASAPTPEFIPNNAVLSATGIISIYNPIPIPCPAVFPPSFSNFGAACSQLSGTFSDGYVDNPNPNSSDTSKGFLICKVNIGNFSKDPVVVWCPSSPAAGIVCDAYQAYGVAEIDSQIGDGSYNFGIYVGATTWPELDPSWTGPNNRIAFNFNIFG
jgi:hypothetical protein